MTAVFILKISQKKIEHRRNVAPSKIRKFLFVRLFYHEYK